MPRFWRGTGLRWSGWDYLLGKDERAKIYVHEEGWYAENAVELLLGRRVTLLDRTAHQVELDSGERIGYAKLLLATGATPRYLRLPGAELDDVHYLRRVENSDRLRETIPQGRPDRRRGRRLDRSGDRRRGP